MSRERYQILVDQIRHHDLLYHQQDAPEIMPVPARSPGVEKAQREMAERARVGGMGEADDEG